MSRLETLLLGVPNLEIPLPTEEKFHLFPELPRELRNKIWKLAAYQPRIIILDDRQRFPSSRYSWSSTVPRQRRHPSMIHTSQEARAEGLRYYELCRERPKSPSNSQRQRGVYWWTIVIFVNFAVDVFHLKPPKQAGDPSNGPNSVNIYNFEPNILRLIQHFALIYNIDAYYTS
jgi:hypothetical protein